jgi:hypothetical protein
MSRETKENSRRGRPRIYAEAAVSMQVSESVYRTVATLAQREKRSVRMQLEQLVGEAVEARGAMEVRS